MSDRSDQYFQPLICPLVENLGHSAPAVRKGALDVLKVYMTETAMAETIILEIISVGMEQKTFFEQYDGRVCVGVMLSMPSLVFTSLGTAKQNHIVRAAIQALTNKMIQVAYQETALKVLLRIREMVGAREFSEHIAHNAYRDFEMLCNVYGLPSTPNTQDPSSDLYLPQTSENSRVWNPVQNSTESNSKVKRTELIWRDKQDETSADEENNNNLVLKSTTVVPKSFSCNGNIAEKGCVQTISVVTKKPENEKVIMETEIQIKDTAVTMRIMEANSNSSENDGAGENSEDDLSSVNGTNNRCNSAVVRVLTDSDDSNGTVVEALDSARNPLKRVTFGGEEVKLRTPDSDSVLQSDNDEAQKGIQQVVEQNLGSNTNTSLNGSTQRLELSGSNQHLEVIGSPKRRDSIGSPKRRESIGSPRRQEINGSPRRHEMNNNNHELKRESNKFAKLNRPMTASIVITKSSPPGLDTDMKKVHRQRHKSASPIKRNRRPSYSSADELSISPRGSHSGIEVLYNLQQRSPNISPTRSRRNSSIDIGTTENISENDKSILNKENLNESHGMIVEEISSPEASRKHFTVNDSIRTWEDLGLVDELCLRNLKSGDWRLRSKAMYEIEEVLKSTENLSLVQPHLESLLRTLLSSEKHPDVLDDKRRILLNLISRLPLDNLEDRATQIIIGLCRQGGAGSNRVAKALMQRLPPTAVVIKLISDDFLKAHSSKFRENALQMVLYALMTFPSTYFDIPTCVKKSAEAANDQKKRVRQAALDVLAVLGQISAPKMVLEEVTETLKHEKEAQRLIAAIKARLSRKQLPSVTPEGSVHYALRIPTPPQVISSYYFGADIDWITAGIGSVSPISAKRRFDTSQLAYNYSSSDSNRSIDLARRSIKELGAYNMGSSSEIENGYSFQKVMPQDDRNTHFVMAAAIPASQMRYPVGSGMHKLNLQSQSFPDLSRRADSKPYTNGKVNPVDGNSKVSRLPVASRFPSMESNIETRNHIGSKPDSNYYHGSSNRYSNYSNSSNFAMRPNGSLPRKFNTNTSIPIRNIYYNYSHGALNSQSSNDESRPSTHPDEYAQPPPKRFVNVDKYLDDSSSDSNLPLKTLAEIRYASQLKSSSHSHEERRLRTEELNRKNAQHDRIESGGTNRSHVLSVHKSPDSQRYTRENQMDSDDAEADADDLSIAITENQRPLSHASTATTRSVRDEAADNLSKRSYSIGQSSIEEIITPKSGATTADNLEVESEAIDTSLEHIQNENNEKLIADESNGTESTEGIDTVDGTVKTAQLIIQTEPEQLLDSPCVKVTKPCEIDDNEARSESETISMTSTEESSDYQVMRQNTATTITVPIGEQKVINKPIPKLRPPIISRRNKIAPVKTYPSNASIVGTHKPAHMFPPSLRKFDKPREASNSCLNQLDSPTWETTMNGIQSFVRMIRHHPELVESNIHAYCVALAKQVRNLRSQVSRSACQASAEFFQTHAKHLEQEGEDLATQLFNRTADTNKFLRADAFRALAAMCDNLPPTKVIQTILTRGATHQNAIDFFICICFVSAFQILKNLTQL